MIRFFPFHNSLSAACSALQVFFLAIGLCAGAARAHELSPSVADFEVAQGQVAMQLRLNLEAFASGMDLDAVVDTGTAEEVELYQSLRGMSEGDLRDEVLPFLEGWLPQFTAQGLGDWTISGLDVPDVGDTELPRLSDLHLRADIKPGVEALSFDWPTHSGALILRQNGTEAPYTGFLIGGSSSPQIPLGGDFSFSAWQAFVAYIPAGFDHILPKGLDHILFVLGLFFFSTRMGPLLWQVSAFTLAHTITLALGTLGVVNLPGSIVEPLIAASITFVAIENLFARRMSRSMSLWRPVVIFCFGLLHGLGFASVLQDFGLPQAQLIPALVGFNVGVELGQLTVIAIAFGLVGYWFRHRPWYFAGIAAPASMLIAAVGAWWFVERVFL